MSFRRCDLCPAPASLECAALHHPRYCELRAREGASGGPYTGFLATGIEPAPAASPAGPHDPRPRACLVTPSMNIGGADRWMIALMESTAHRVRWTAVACVSDAFVVPEIRAEADRFAPSTVGTGHVRAALAGAEVAVCWGVPLDQVAELAGDGPRARIVGVSHGVGDWTRSVFERHELAHALVAVSGAALRGFPEEARNRAVVIENRAEPGRLAPRSVPEAVRAAWGIGPGEKALVQVGRLSPEKNPTAFADAVAHLNRTGHPEWRAVHVGTGWVEAEVRAHAEEAAPGLVRFPGTTDDVAAAYLAADALALPSLEEACSLMQIEAMWAGAPLIASAVGLTEDPDVAALCRVVRPGCSGEELAEALLADLADPEGTRARARKARALARLRFAPERFASAWADLIERAAGPRPALNRAPTSTRSGGSAATREPAQLPANMPLAEYRRREKLVNACPHRGCRVSCQLTECSHPEKPNRVYLSDCIQCPTAIGPVPAGPTTPDTPAPETPGTGA